jgi:hypothetical protein
MIHAQNSKHVNLITPQSVATNGTATGTVSLAGWDYAEVVIRLSTAVASNTDVTLTLTEGDGTSFATASDLAMTTAAPDTSNPQIYKWMLDVRKRKKNLKLTYAPNTSVARVASAECILSRGEQAPTTATLRGLSAQVVA